MTARNELRIAKRASRFDRLIGLAYLVVTLAGLAWAKEFLLPIILAALISFLLAPLISRLERAGLGRVFAVLKSVAAGIPVRAPVNASPGLREHREYPPPVCVAGARPGAGLVA
jgi:predicted PurR-regulated permease PerM